LVDVRLDSITDIKIRMFFEREGYREEEKEGEGGASSAAAKRTNGRE
jgi:hypothetical protein